MKEAFTAANMSMYIYYAIIIIRVKSMIEKVDDNGEELES